MPATDVDEIRHSALWSHLVKVVAEVVSQRPEDGMEALVSTSHRVLTGQASAPEALHIPYCSAAASKTISHTATAAAAATHAADIPADILTSTCWASNFIEALAPPKPLRRPHNRFEDDDYDDFGSGGEHNNNSGSIMDHHNNNDEDYYGGYDRHAEAEAAAQRGDDLSDVAQVEELPGVLADVVTEQSVFNELGAGLSVEEALRLTVGLRQLLRNEPLANVRFWGKIMGRWKDYYIAETKWDTSRAVDYAGVDENGNYIDDMNERGGGGGYTSRTHADNANGDDDYDDDKDENVDSIAKVLTSHAAPPQRASPPEPSGTGLNEFVYYVANSRDPTKWTRLGDVVPRHIVAARQICHAFTGNLHAPVHSHPRFIGTEQHYLRAQIARITAACKIAPRDLYTTTGAEPEEDDAEEEEHASREGYSRRNNNSNNSANAGSSYTSRGFNPDESTRHTNSSSRSRPARLRKVAAYTSLPQLLPQETPDEEDGDSVRAVQAWYRGYSKDELLQGRYWVHIAPTILQQGRVTAANRADWAEDDDEEDLVTNANNGLDSGNGKATPTEWIHPFLSEVTSDDALVFPGHSRSSLPAWSFRSGFRNESSVTGAYLARSMRWFGAMTYAVTHRGKPGAQYQMMYIGTGLKNRQGEDYVPEFAPAMMREYVDNEEVLALPRDCTADEELEYTPPPPPPPPAHEEDGDEEDEAEDDDE